MSTRRGGMSGDYKYDAQVLAEEWADQRYGLEFYDLPKDTQGELYEEALNYNAEKMLAAADYRRKAQKENGL
jgi:hypothetical protein